MLRSLPNCGYSLGNIRQAQVYAIICFATALAALPLKANINRAGIISNLQGSVIFALSDTHPDITSWREAYFSDPNNATKSGDQDDPDRDGKLNLIEYALCMDPMSPSGNSEPSLKSDGDDLLLHYNRARSDVNYIVESSEDLVSWTTTGVDQGANIIGQVTARVQNGVVDRKIVRLRVENPNGFVSLYNSETILEPPTAVETDMALYTYFADRARDRHAREDQFEAYDHYLSFYWEHRTAAVEIIDTIGKGGNSITFNVETQWKLSDNEAELRFFYRGENTVAEYHNNGVMTPIDDTHYTRTVSYNNKEKRPLQVGDRMEFELSQFLDGAPNGRDNYYGTTYLYIVGQGLVPWEARGTFGDSSTELEDSYPIPEKGWLGGKTTLPYMYSGEPDDHFMQMATNLSNINGQTFVLGRRVHHTDFGDGSHDEGTDNPPFVELSGKLGTRYINRSCVACHTKNGRALPPDLNTTLDQYVVKVGDGSGKTHPELGAVLQPRTTEGDSEGSVVIKSWIESNGLRSPAYDFNGIDPAQFSARIAPQLVGMGLLEAIPESSIQAMADPNDSNGDGISGRLNIITDPETGEQRVGRFGWKAGKSSVRTQVAAALNTDMGVMTSVFPNPDLGTVQSDAGDAGAELGDTHLVQLTAYVSLLGVRAQRDLEDHDVIQGEALFNSAKCIDCHTPTFTTSAYHPHAELRNQTIHPYTDLLLHDMGPGLADNLGEGLASGSEWRTPPLWGIGLTNGVSEGEAYLHDGRARTLTEAILWHGGEAQNSKDAFEAMTQGEQDAVIKFLQSL